MIFVWTLASFQTLISDTGYLGLVFRHSLTRCYMSLSIPYVEVFLFRLWIPSSRSFPKNVYFAKVTKDLSPGYPTLAARGASSRVIILNRSDSEDPNYSMKDGISCQIGGDKSKLSYPLVLSYKNISRTSWKIFHLGIYFLLNAVWIRYD